MKATIPVYDICHLNQFTSKQNEILIEHFGEYLKRHPQSLHLPHRHTFYQLVLFIQGTGEHKIDFLRYKVKPFQIYFMAPGQVHSWHFASEQEGYIINFSDTLFQSFLLNVNYLERFSFFSGVSENCVISLPIAFRERVISLLEALLAEVSGTQDTDPDMVRALLIQLFVMVERTSKSGRPKALPRQKQLLLNNFRQLIDRHYRSFKLPKEYADLLYVTPNHLNALCQDLLDKTAGELIRDRILLEAKRLLTNVDMTIGEIGYELNFKDNSYFTRFFRKYTGWTPEEFRHRLMEQIIT